MDDESWSDDGWPYGSWRDDGWDDHAAAFPAPAPTSKDVVQNGGRDARDEEMKFQNCKQMMEDLRKAFEEKNSLDVTVNCGDASFECYKFMLTARSPVFKAMFQHDTKENQTNVVNLKDIEPRVLEEMMLYIHTGDAPNVKQLAKELLAVADFYQLNQLKYCCQEVLSETLDAKNSIGVLILSDMHSAMKLRRDALKFVSENMNSVSLSCDWKKELAYYPSLQSEIISLQSEIIESLKLYV